MSFAGKVWRLLVGIKDGLVLVFMLLFFAALFGILAARPNPGAVRDGALFLKLDGVVVEEKSNIDPFQALLSPQTPVNEYRARDLVRAIDAAAGDERITAIALDLTQFLGGGQVHLQHIGAAMDRFRAVGKPIMTYAVGYADDGMMLAAHASEIWMDPLGGAAITGPGGERLYYAGLLDRLDVNAHVYKVGEYKSAVEPFTRSDMSPAARENYTALYGALWEEWQANVKQARPAMNVGLVTNRPVEWVEAAGGDLATAAKSAGLVDQLGSYADFGDAVAKVAGEHSWDETPGTFASTDLEPWLADIGYDTPGKAIGVVTIAGEIVDGDAGPGTAGGDRIAELLNDALDDDLAALVVRVDSPGGSVLASEEIRRGILRHKANGIPIVVSMANVAASGGYWVSTPAERIFAEPETVTGSIGIFAVIPTFEQVAAKYGVNSDGVRTTPLSGQPDLIGGFTPEVDRILQLGIEDGYRDFIARVAQSRNLTAAQVDAIGQGRVWDGGAARQIGLVDQYGGLEDALAYAAQKAELGDGEWHAQFLGGDIDPYQSILRGMLASDSGQAAPGDLFGMIARQQAVLGGRMADDLDRLLGTRGMQAYCLECPATPRASAMPMQGGWLERFAMLFAD